MAKYNFKLEKVLNYKEKVEDLKKNEFAESSHKLNIEEEKLLYYNNYKESLLNKKRATNSASIGQYKLYSSYIDDLSKKIKNQKNSSKCQEEFDKAKEELLVAMQERKSFEKLKEIQYEEYLLDMKKGRKIN